MKTETVRVRINDRIETFANAQAAQAYALKWGGEILAANEPAAVQKLGSQSVKPTYNPFTATLLGLPASPTVTEYQTAWLANGSQSAVLKTAAVREALIQLAMREQNFSRVRAEAYALARYPKLHKSALSKVGTGANEKSGGMKPSDVAGYLASGERLASNEVQLAVGPTVRR